MTELDTGDCDEIQYTTHSHIGIKTLTMNCNVSGLKSGGGHLFFHSLPCYLFPG